MRRAGVALFDSGIGGLTVLAECRKYFPDTDFYYYGDNKHAPYGNLSETQIFKYVEKAFSLFKKLRVRAVVLACNTVTAVCVETLRKEYAMPIIGAEPAIMTAAKRGGKVFVLATCATCNSSRFSKLCQKAHSAYPSAQIISYACEGLAGEIEEHLSDLSYDFTQNLPTGNPDGVVLGCTHYIYLKERISEFYRCPCYDGNVGIVNRLKNMLFECKKNAALTQKNKIRQKNRDRRPLFPNLSERSKCATTRNPRKLKGIKANKCSWLRKAKGRQKKGRIYFLGSGKRRNKAVFERMFAE